MLTPGKCCMRCNGALQTAATNRTRRRRTEMSGATAAATPAPPDVAMSCRSERRPSSAVSMPWAAATVERPAATAASIKEVTLRTAVMPPSTILGSTCGAGPGRAVGLVAELGKKRRATSPACVPAELPAALACVMPHTAPPSTPQAQATSAALMRCVTLPPSSLCAGLPSRCGPRAQAQQQPQQSFTARHARNESSRMSAMASATAEPTALGTSDCFT